MRRAGFCIVIAAAFLSLSPAVGAPDIVRSVTIRAGRDMGYFAGDLVKVAVDITVANGYEIDTASLPRAGPINYWLDLRKIDVARHAATEGTQTYRLAITYQDFYDALDARPQEIPTFPVVFAKGTERVTADVPAWTIAVSPLREIAPPPKDDPKDYMRKDARASLVDTSTAWWVMAFALLAMVLSLAVLAYERATWPFHQRPDRAFADVWRRLRRLAADPDTDQRYLDALLLVHRGIDRTDKQRILADDLPAFLTRHPVFVPLRDGLEHFFAASRHAFFGRAPARSQATMPFKAVNRLARDLAAAERRAT